MIPIRVCVEGFMSYRDRAELNFEGSPLWMLTGDNGAGKSAVFDAVSYALYGFHRLGDNENFGELINKNSNQMWVEFDFAIDNDLFRVKRTYSRKGRGTYQAWQFRGGYTDGLALDYEKNLIIVPGTEKEKGFCDWVRETIGLDKKAFPAAVLLRQGKTDALLTALPSQRHPILAQIVDLSKYQNLHSRAVERKKEFEIEEKRLRTQLENCPPVAAEHIENLTAEIETLTNDFAEAGKSCDGLIELKVRAENWEKLVAEKTKLESEIRQAEVLFRNEKQIETEAAEAEELNAVLPVLENLFADRSRRAKTIERKREFDELESEIAQLKTSLSEIEAARRAFPLWENYCRERSVWRTACREGERLENALQILREEISQTEIETDEAHRLQDQAAGERNEAKTALERAKINLDNALDKSERFSSLKDSPKCDWCGQELTAEHRSDEFARLEKDLQSAKSRSESARNDFERAESNFETHQSGHYTLAEQLQSLRADENKKTQQLDLARSKQKGAALNSAKNLSALHEIAASPLQSFESVEDCLADNFPNEEELGEIERQSELYDERKKQFDSGESRLRRLAPSLGELKVIEENIARLEISLTDEWHERSCQLSEKDLRELQAKARRLADARQKLEELREARRDQTTRNKRLAEIEAEINEIDPRARRAGQEIADEEADLRDQKGEIEKRLEIAKNEKQKLEDRRRRRQDLEKNRREAAHKLALYGELAKNLGAEKLQRWLLQDAERSIVTLANHFLDRVSSHTLRLKLKNEDATENTTAATKALDLVAYYEKAGIEPLPVDALSGGQRFRVAVSLALGIGQYASGGTRHLESVIIDEGFGSLDREGRNEMIAALNQLKNELRRIIIVSHQDEVAQTFSNNKYLIEQTDGSSRARLIDGFE